MPTSSDTTYGLLKLIKYKLILDKGDATFRPGDCVFGIFNVISVPKGMPEINGIFLEFYGQILVKDILRDKQEAKRIVEVKRFFIGSELGTIGPLKVRSYRFDFVIPENSSCTYTGQIGWIKYQVGFGIRTTIPFSRIILDSSDLLAVTNIFTFDDFWGCPFKHQLTILPNTITQWRNRKELMQPMLIQKHIFSGMMRGKILISLFTKQKCYGSGDSISFEVKVQNSGGKNIKKIGMQLQQVVTYNFGAHKRKEKSILQTNMEGPSVPSDAIQIWNGELQIPSDVLPSVEEYSILNSLKLYDFQYYLRVILEVSGILISEVSEVFPIQIGCPLKQSRNSGTCRNLGFGPNYPSRSNNDRRISMVSLAPSLPGYEEAMSSFGSGLPSYSCLDLSLHHE